MIGGGFCEGERADIPGTADNKRYGIRVFRPGDRRKDFGGDREEAGSSPEEREFLAFQHPRGELVLLP